MNHEPAATRVEMPAAPLRSCVRAYVFRNTVKAPLADPAQRLNRFPASPLCSITWFMQGEAEMVDPPPVEQLPFTPIFLGGPRSRPIVSYNPGPIDAFSVMFYPDALHRLTGLDMVYCVDRFQLLPGVLAPEWVAIADAVLHAPDDAARVALVEDFLTPRVAELPGAPLRVNGGMEWIGRLAMQAASLRFGSGVRSVERRVKAWSGQPMRTLRRMGRAEESFLEARSRMGTGDGKVAWADIAAQAGYADQAHLSRAARDITGLSPTDLVRASDDDESYWLYRIWV
jgi:AraC-like DNA-binding protein